MRNRGWRLALQKHRIILIISIKAAKFRGLHVLGCLVLFCSGFVFSERNESSALSGPALRWAVSFVCPLHRHVQVFRSIWSCVFSNALVYILANRLPFGPYCGTLGINRACVTFQLVGK